MTSPYEIPTTKEAVVDTRELIFNLIDTLGLELADKFLFTIAADQCNPKTSTTEKQLLGILANYGYTQCRIQYLEAQNADPQAATDS